MHSKNEVELSFDARSVNEGFARMAVAAFITELNPTMDELSDVKTAVSEAVTNAIIHGYDNPEEKVHMTCRIMGREVEIIVCDTGRGIEDVAQAMEPFYTTKPELERSGMGFAFMEAFMDEVHVQSAPGKGTSVRMKNTLACRKAERYGTLDGTDQTGSRGGQGRKEPAGGRKLGTGARGDEAF